MPDPPPGIGVPAGSVAFVVLAVIGVFAAGDIAAAGEVPGVGEAVFVPNQERLAGLGEAAGDTEGAAACLCLAGLAEGSGLAAGDVAAPALGAGDASFFTCLRLAGLAEASGLALGDGDWATNETSKNAVNVIMREIDLVMAG